MQDLRVGPCGGDDFRGLIGQPLEHGAEVVEDRRVAHQRADLVFDHDRVGHGLVARGAEGVDQFIGRQAVGVGDEGAGLGDERRLGALLRGVLAGGLAEPLDHGEGAGLVPAVDRLALASALGDGAALASAGDFRLVGDEVAAPLTVDREALFADVAGLGDREAQGVALLRGLVLVFDLGDDIEGRPRGLTFGGGDRLRRFLAVRLVQALGEAGGAEGEERGVHRRLGGGGGDLESDN